MLNRWYHWKKFKYPLILKSISLFFTVPLEILARGPEALRAYEKALKDGKTHDRRVPVMIVGQDRSGKTSLKRSLKGEPFNSNEDSTIGIEIDPSLCQITTEVWRNRSPDENVAEEASYERHAAMVTLRTLEQQSRKETQETQMSESDVMHTVPAKSSFRKKEIIKPETAQQSERETQKIGIDSEVPLADPGHEESSSQEKESVSTETEQKIGNEHAMQADSGRKESSLEHASAVLEEMQKILAEGGATKDDAIDFVLWDFAGQSLFYTTHALFMSRIAMYILTHNLSEELHGKAVLEVKQGTYKRCIEDTKCETTNMDFIHYWLSSVHALSHNAESSSNSEELPPELPAVVLVCTHADKPASGTDPEKVVNDIMSNLEGKSYENHLVQKVFTVDNTRSQRSEEENIKQLCHLILQLARQLPHLKELIPLR